MKKLLIFREEEKFKSRNRNEENSKYFDRFGKLVGLFFDKIDFPIIDDFIDKIKFKTIEECSNYQIPFVSLGFFINYFQDAIQTSKSHEDTLARDTNIYNFMKKYHVFEVLDQYLDRNSNKYIADGIVSMFGSVIPIPNESPLCEYSHDIIRIFVKSITFVGSIQRCFLSKFHKFFNDFTDEEIVMLKISLMNNLLNSIKTKSESDLCDILRLVFYKKSEFFLIDVNELIQRLFTR
ncbi:hypothetical protein TRFO_34480 [Tritrichomonas foetus]|uniref:Uncharacterized protein n=1 Tax=Tritrichomonas foetus TaxID=1144522 RepID=A0A1J4JNP1_9EUKA|nr:hypothetical protein TRFO_34480 [Tritrichomonas foetus]|eukprot:OHS99131.1 hypothetical protein TRFO_34480 [Tritrichomonas foetus]